MTSMHVSESGGMKELKEAKFGLVPPRPLELLAVLYGRGAGKYGPRNWERGFEWSVAFDAMQRHAWKFWNGENYDAEMRVPHLTCVAFHAFSLTEFLLDMEDETAGAPGRHRFDDRPSTIFKRVDHDG